MSIFRWLQLPIFEILLDGGLTGPVYPLFTFDPYIHPNNGIKKKYPLYSYNWLQ